ncbi:MAG: A/G-specific adenine glycosylase [Bacteroidales bacterium]|nr:A/G-specific adenine glycosylase [Bacteroidales bacterium]
MKNIEKEGCKDAEFVLKLIEWYKENKRDLPWRLTTDPYKIWLSETILQQTRVAQGLGYYNRILSRFPTLADLAQGTEEEILRLWQGLGYYSRARNMHAAAKDIVARFDGEFPADYKAMRSLKGIGDYTAAAILSFAWNLPYAVVDGNVYRVLSRLFGIDIPIDSVKGKRCFGELAQSLLPEEHAGIYNQALMEFGALQCEPANPDCSVCPFKDRCVAYARNKVSYYPVKEKKNKRRERYFTYLHIHSGGKLYLQRRQERDIWKGLYQFPLVEADALIDVLNLPEKTPFDGLLRNKEYKVLSVVDMPKHILSHQILYTRFIEINLKEPLQQVSPYSVIEDKKLDNYALPVLIVKYLDRMNR